MGFKNCLKALLAGFLLLGQSAHAAELVPLPAQPENLAWPTNGWQQTSMPPNTAAQVSALLQSAMSQELDDVMGETRAVVIIHKGKLVAERYRDGFGPETKQLSWSMAKSVTSALVGRAVRLGMIKDIDEAMPGPWGANDARSKISWRQWLNMTDGLAYAEIGEDNLQKNDVVQMMFGQGRFDTISYAKELPQAYAPGSHWNYSTAGFHLLSSALQGLIAAQKNVSPPAPAQMVDFANAKLFDPLQMNVSIEFDPAGTYLGGSLVWASARDFAKFGFLYLRDGVWDGERLLPEGWVDFSRTKTPADNATVYGAGWWINAANPDDIRPSGQGSAIGPRDAFSAQGHEGQVIWVVPSRDLVIVRLGLMGNGEQNWPALYDWSQKIAMAFPAVK
ncbi:Beta-lactamase class C-like and penicillin binding proteins (PBPs) superfamily [hydrothermal vent metagenome]|uniref:Beta-lactamase class C-like and penicillin binding proteins (PBPs) superfamily n=1 Tax=hydrothermal vent metagenome TaxID=652676 RepID=A0A3B0RSK2_9ZZZZ